MMIDSGLIQVPAKFENDQFDRTRTSATQKIKFAITQKVIGRFLSNLAG